MTEPRYDASDLMAMGRQEIEEARADAALKAPKLVPEIDAALELHAARLAKLQTIAIILPCRASPELVEALQALYDQRRIFIFPPLKGDNYRTIRVSIALPT